MSRLFLLLIFLISTSTASSQLNENFQLIPTPQHIECRNEGSYKWSDVSFIEGGSIPVLGRLLNDLPRRPVRNKKGVILTLSDDKIHDSDEGYVLSIDKDRISIKSSSEKGLFYGCATLEQLMQDSKLHDLNLPEMTITDYPSVAYRAIHIDNKHHLDRMEYYYSMIDRLSSYKINAIIWELEDKLRYVRRPEIAASNAISKQEMQAISRYAIDRNIEISPLVQGLGHAGFILKHHPELRENPDSDWEFCPSDARTYELQFDLYKDAMEALPHGKYLHVGGDEITAIGIDERCKQTGKTAFELQMIWLGKVCDFAIRHDRTPIFWDDMPLKYAGVWDLIRRDLTPDELLQQWNVSKLDEAIDFFPKDCIYMRWNYQDPTKPAHLKILEWYKNKGLQVMAATAAADGGCPFMPRDDSRALNIKNFSSLVAQNKLTGILATAWDDGSPHLETVMRGFIAQAEYGWNPQDKNIDSFKKAHAQREYGFMNGEMCFLDTLEKQAFLFDDLLISSGRRNPSWQVRDYTLIELPDKSNPGEWSKKYQTKINAAERMRQNFIYMENEINDALATARNNRYTIRVYQQNNRLFYYPAQLLLALHKYDTASTPNERAAALLKVRQTCDSFNEMRKDLENVYSETRFMTQPEDYLEDLNHHKHLSALSLNSDWLYLYELPFTQQTDAWISQP